MSPSSVYSTAVLNWVLCTQLSTLFSALALDEFCSRDNLTNTIRFCIACIKWANNWDVIIVLRSFVSTVLMWQLIFGFIYVHSYAFSVPGRVKFRLSSLAESMARVVVFIRVPCSSSPLWWGLWARTRRWCWRLGTTKSYLANQGGRTPARWSERFGLRAHLSPTKRRKLDPERNPTQTYWQGKWYVCNSESTQLHWMCRDDGKTVYLCGTRKGKICFAQHIQSAHDHEGSFNYK
jgi:hypothetical protein